MVYFSCSSALHFSLFVRANKANPLLSYSISLLSASLFVTTRTLNELGRNTLYSLQHPRWHCFHYIHTNIVSTEKSALTLLKLQLPHFHCNIHTGTVHTAASTSMLSLFSLQYPCWDCFHCNIHIHANAVTTKGALAYRDTEARLGGPAQWSSGTVCTLRLVGCGFDPHLGHTNGCNTDTNCLPAWQSVFGLRKGG